DGNYASQPDFALGPGGNIYVIFSQLISERDDSSKNYEHVYAARSTDYGTTWGAAVDITPGTGFDASFPSVADDADDSLYIVYNSDRLAGNFVQGNHPVTQVAINFLKVPVSTLPLTGIRELQARIPTQFQLLQNYPNPFNSETHIRYSLPRQAQVTLGIYNVLGQEVTRLVDDIKPAGTDEVVWDGSDRAGIRVASSVYLLRLSTEGRQMTKLMMLIR
ncbi:MAG: T9SS type A sorting domain-containing protein, partial [Ignavibacteriae bacterium]|nr:T9SS type A sorting domain-containing protein [Ignavibacteriota bacterium]